MKMFLKMKNRDRNLLILLLAIIVFYVCYTFIMAPHREETELMQTELQSVRDELKRAEDFSGREEEMRKQEAGMKAEIIEKYSVFFTDIDQARILYRLDNIAVGAGLPIASYTPSPEGLSQVIVEKGFYTPPEYPLQDLAFKIAPELREAGDEDASGGDGPVPAGSESADMIPGTDVAVGFETASYESIYSFIGAVENMNRTTFLKSIDLSEKEGGLQGQLLFSFYSLPRLDKDQKDGLDFRPAIPLGKPNPFN